MKHLQVFPKINRAYREAIEYFSNTVGGWGISVEEGNLLVYLSRFSPCSISQISKVVGLKPSTLTSMLDRLERQNILRRVPHPEDRRSILINIDEKGALLAQQIVELVAGLEDDVFNDITEEQLEGFFAVLKAVNNRMRVSLKD